jgi:hypothetical protein
MSYKGTSKYIGKFIKGQKINKWTIVSGDILIAREAMVECKCECGNVKFISAYTLVKGTSKQCSECGNSLKKEKNPAWNRIIKVPRKVIKRVSTEEGKQYAAQLIETQNFKCALTGVDISFDDHTASLDRIDSSKLYEIGNMQWVHKDANVMKNGYNLFYFIKMCKLVADKFKDIDVSEAQNDFIFGNTNKKK